MEVLLANPRGFCAGVNMAIESLSQALERFGAPIYVFHEIVHNRHVVQEFKERGVVFVDSLAAVPENAVVMYSAHGVAPSVRRDSEMRHLRSIDATCPLVTKVHLEAIRFAKEGFQIVLVGHRDHDEVVGTMGQAPKSIHLVETVEDVERLTLDPTTPLAYLTQTTLSMDDARLIISALVAKYPNITGPKKQDICYATQNRQEAVKSLIPVVDLVLVVGSRNSSNSLRLAEIALQRGTEAHLIDGASEIQSEWFEGKHTVMVTAGASAPERLVKECVEKLRAQFGAEVREVPGVVEKVSFGVAKELRNLDG